MPRAERPLRIARIIARLNVGGPARHVVWLTAALEGREFHSALITGVVPPGEDDMSAFARDYGVEPVIIPEMSREISPRDLVTVWKLFHFFWRFRPDIVDTHTAKAGTAGRVAGILGPEVIADQPDVAAANPLGLAAAAAVGDRVADEDELALGVQADGHDASLYRNRRDRSGLPEDPRLDPRRRTQQLSVFTRRRRPTKTSTP